MGRDGDSQSRTKVEGAIVQAKEDSEHNRCLYIVSKTDNDQYHFYIFTNAKLYERTGEVKACLVNDFLIIPFYSPASKSQFIIYTPGDNDSGIFRVFDFNSKAQLTKPMKVEVDWIQQFTRESHKIHTMLSTNLNKNLIFINDADMVIMDLSAA